MASNETAKEMRRRHQQEQNGLTKRMYNLYAMPESLAFVAQAFDCTREAVGTRFKRAGLARRKR